MSNLTRPRRALAALALVFVSACVDRNPVAPIDVPEPRPEPTIVAQIRCTVEVQSGSMSCSPVAIPPAPSGARYRIVGAQDSLVKLANTNYQAYGDSVTTDVTVQNLMQFAMGSTNGTTVTGVYVFFQDDIVAFGGGSAAVVADGTDAFTDMDQEYYLYNQIVPPLEISSSRKWKFVFTGTVTSFSFVVAVSADLVNDPGGDVLLGYVWDGSLSTAWDSAANWADNAVPSDTNSVTVLSTAVSSVPNMPALQSNVQIVNLSVGTGSTLNLNNLTLQASGNVLARGTVSSGTIRMSGTNKTVNGNVGALEITGSASLEGAVKATGAVSVTGALSIQSTSDQNRALNISVP